MDQQWKLSFQEKLDQHYSWPALYIFKFIVPAGKEQELKDLFPMHESTQKQSTKGKYSSITIQMMMPSGAEVVRIYERAATIEGLIAL